MKSEPWARFNIRSTPKTNVSPEARIKKVIPLVIPLRKKRKNIEESTAHSPFLRKKRFAHPDMDTAQWRTTTER